MSLFTYLHVHTHFSLGGGPASPEMWSRRAADLGYASLAIADRSPLTGFPRFLEASGRDGISPIFGVELGLLFPGGKREPVAQPALIFACDEAGMANLAGVCSVAYRRWAGAEAGVEWQELASRAGGLVVILLGGDEAGALAPLVEMPPAKQVETGKLIQASFSGRAFLGVPHSGRPGDGAIAGRVVKVGSEVGLPPVALPAARYLNPDDAPAYEALRLARGKAGWASNGASGQATGSTGLGGPGPHYLRPPSEAAALFATWPETLDNLARVVELCSGAGPVFQRGGGKGAEAGPPVELAERKLLARLGVATLPEGARERLQAELDACAQGGRAGSWLALASLRDPVTRGGSGNPQLPVVLGEPTGSADGSLLAYAFGLSSLDPVPYSPPAWLGASAPPQLPGIQVPSGSAQRFAEALTRGEGTGRVACAACSNAITPRAALSAAATVLGLPEESASELIKPVSGEGWAGLREYTPEGGDAKMSKLAALALALEEAPVNFVPDPHTLLVATRVALPGSTVGDWLPLLTSPTGAAWVPWSEEALCRLGYPALTLEPSNPLSALEKGLRLVERYPVAAFPLPSDLSEYPEVDEQAAQVLRRHELVGIPFLTVGVVPPEGPLTPEALALMVARSITEGCSAGKEGIGAWEECTRDTGGLLIYKDQLSTLLSAIEDKPEGTAALRAFLRKGDDEAKADFVQQCVSSGLDEESGDVLWSALSGRTHTLVSRSVAYERGRLAAWSALLKAHHPVAFIAGALDAAWERTGRAGVQPLMQEAHRLDITVRPPDAEHGLPAFNLERDGTGWSIKWGLARLPGWDMALAEQFVVERPAAGFSTFEALAQVAQRAGVGEDRLRTLVRVGGCDRLGGKERSRTELLEALAGTVQQTRNSAGNKSDMFSVADPSAPAGESILTAPLTPGERHLYRTWEEACLGVGFTPAPEMDDLRRALENSGDLKSRLLSTTQIGMDHVGQSVSLVGLLASPLLIEGKGEHAGEGANTTPTTMSVAWVEDLEGSIELVAFPPNYHKHREQWTGSAPVIVTARVCTHESGDIYLLCEHLSPFHAEAVEEGFSITVKAPVRTGTRKTDPKQAGPGPTHDDDKVAAVVAPQTAPLRTSGAPAPAPAQTPGAVATREGSSPTYSLVITLPDEDSDNAAIDSMSALNRLLGKHPGSDSVTLRIPYSPETGSVTSAPLPYGVQYSPRLEAEITHLLGPAALAVIKIA